MTEPVISPSTMVGQYFATLPTFADGTPSYVQTDAKGRLLVVVASESVGSVTYGAPTAVAVTAGPTSTTLIAANAARKTLSIWNPIGNAQMSVDIAGGTAVLATGRPLLAGATLDLTGADCPVGAVTFIGTAGQSLVYQQGT